MGTFAVEIGIAPLDRRAYQTVEAITDTGATYMTLPASLLQDIDVAPHERRTFMLANSSHIEQGIMASLGAPRREGEITLVVLGADRSSPLLGAVAFEIFGLAGRRDGEAADKCAGALVGPAEGVTPRARILRLKPYLWRQSR